MRPKTECTLTPWQTRSDFDLQQAATFLRQAKPNLLMCAVLEIDMVMRERAPAGWKGDQAREAQVQNALFPLLDRDRDATRALFELIKNQPGY